MSSDLDQKSSSLDRTSTPFTTTMPFAAPPAAPSPDSPPPPAIKESSASVVRETVKRGRMPSDEQVSLYRARIRSRSAARSTSGGTGANGTADDDESEEEDVEEGSGAAAGEGELEGEMAGAGAELDAFVVGKSETRLRSWLTFVRARLRDQRRDEPGRSLAQRAVQPQGPRYPLGTQDSSLELTVPSSLTPENARGRPSRNSRHPRSSRPPPTARMPSPYRALVLRTDHAVLHERSRRRGPTRRS